MKYIPHVPFPTLISSPPFSRILTTVNVIIIPSFLLQSYHLHTLPWTTMFSFVFFFFYLMYIEWNTYILLCPAYLDQHYDQEVQIHYPMSLQIVSTSVSQIISLSYSSLHLSFCQCVAIISSTMWKGLCIFFSVKVHVYF